MRFLVDAGRRQDIGIAQLAFSTCKITDLDQAFLGEGFQAKVDAAEADAELSGDLALTRGGVTLEHAHHAQFELVSSFNG